MPNYAIVKNDLVVNVIIADNLEIANEVIANSIEYTELHKDAICVEEIENMPMGIGYKYIDGKFIAPEPNKEKPKALTTS